MFDEIKKSLSSTLNERISSPLYGSLIISWLISNWEIVYVTIFIDKDKIAGTKIDYIKHYVESQNHFLCLPVNIVWLPILFTLLFVTLFPLLSSFAVYVPTIANRINKNIRITQLESTSFSGKEHADLLRELDAEKEVYARSRETSLRHQGEIATLKSQISQYQQTRSTVGLFSGKWKKTFTVPGQVERSEVLEIVNEKEYRISGDRVFGLTQIEVDRPNKQIRFVLSGARKNNKDVRLVNELNILTDAKYQGIENGTTSVIYEQIET